MSAAEILARAETRLLELWSRTAERYHIERKARIRDTAHAFAQDSTGLLHWLSNTSRRDFRFTSLDEAVARLSLRLSIEKDWLIKGDWKRSSAEVEALYERAVVARYIRRKAVSVQMKRAA